MTLNQLQHRPRAVDRRRQRAHAAAALDHELLGPRGPGDLAPDARGSYLERAQRLEDPGLRRHLDGRGHELAEGVDQRPDQRPVADEHDGSVDLGAIVEGVHVARHAFEQAAKQAAVVFALIGEMRELALGEHGAARGHGDAAVGGTRQGDGLVERAAESRAEPLDRLAGACRATLVFFVVDPSAGVAREH